MKKGLFILFFVICSAGLAFYIATPRPLTVDEIKQKGFVENDSRFIAINGVNTHFTRHGAGETLLLIHGFGSSTYTWRGMIDRLAKDFEVIAIDLPGFGLSQTLNTTPTVEAYVDFINDFIQTLELDHAVLIGNSFGGEISWRFALKYPQRTPALILLDAAGYPHASPVIFKLLRVPLLGELIAGINAKWIVRKNLQQVFVNEDLVTDAVVDNYYYRLLKAGNRETLLARARMKADTLYKALPQIRQPALIVWGENDSWIPLEFARRFAADLPQAQLAVLPHCGHVPQEEKPEEVSQLIKTFLASIVP